MRRFLSLTAIAAVAMSLTTTAPHAQSVEQIHAKLIKEWLAQPRGKREPIKTIKDTRFAIPASAHENIRFGFEKRMALTGHGVLFDLEGNEVELKPDEMQSLQDDMLKAVRQDAEKNLDKASKGLDELLELTAELEKTVRAKDLKPQQRFIAQNLLVRAHAYQMKPRFSRVYLWRTEYLRGRWTFVHKLELIRPLRLIDDRIYQWYKRWRLIGNRDATQYMRDCADASVPIPPDFAPNGTDWTQQGTLNINMLVPGARADAFTWSSPHVEGGCVALPRYGAGNTPSLAGILCQSAKTGRACIWDSKVKGTGAPINWETTTMVISNLMDGTELGGCPDCHKGNNAFLVAPDDPTWCRMLRGNAGAQNCLPITGVNTNQFTLGITGNVRQVPDADGDPHSRFLFMSGTPQRSDWGNDAVAGCGDTCHLAGDYSLLVRSGPANAPRQVMQPACMTNCYQ